MELIEVNDSHYEFLYRLLEERPDYACISHEEMPSIEEHIEFVESEPYRAWCIVRHNGEDVGACYIGHDNSVGIAIAEEHQGNGYSKEAVSMMMQAYDPLPSIRGKRAGYFFANIAPYNVKSMMLFEKIGFEKLQVTYRMKKNDCS